MARRKSSLDKPGSSQKFPPVMYGLEGIRQIFGVSKSTAYKYLHGILKDACAKNGNVIVIDVWKALSDFGVRNPERFVNS